MPQQIISREPMKPQRKTVYRNGWSLAAFNETTRDGVTTRNALHVFVESQVTVG